MQITAFKKDSVFLYSNFPFCLLLYIQNSIFYNNSIIYLLFGAWLLLTFLRLPTQAPTARCLLHLNHVMFKSLNWILWNIQIRGVVATAGGGADTAESYLLIQPS